MARATERPGFFEEPLATQMEAKRDEARRKRRITYDCFNAVVKGDKVVCAQGGFASPIPLLTVLRGRSSAICQKCPVYDDGEES